MNKTYLFYDIETTGLNPVFDQIVQFAGIRVDENFNELETYNIHIKLRNDIIPSPYAIITHNLPLNENAICEYEAILEIHKILNSPKTISIGYNSLSFDDEFLRFSFYRNLLDPYSHQYANECSRVDLLIFSMIYFVHKQDIINWGRKEDGKISLALERLNDVNNFIQGEAHNALVDVQILLKLAKKFYKEKAVWDYIFGFFNIEKDKEKIEELPDFIKNYKFGILYQIDFGGDNSYQSIVLLLGNSNHYKKQVLCLRLDLKEFEGATLENFKENIFAIRKKLGELPIILPPKERFLKLVKKEKLDMVEKNKKWLLENSTLFEEIVRYYKDYKYSFIPNLDCDANLYQAGFMSPKDKKLAIDFHLANLEEKNKFISKFKDENTKMLAIRLLGRNYPEKLSNEFKSIFNSFMNKVNSNEENAITDYKGVKRNTKDKALKEILELKNQNLNEKQIDSLNKLEQILNQ